MNKTSLGALLAILSVLAFTLISVLAKLLGQAHLGVSELIFWRFLIGLILIVPCVLFDKDFKPRIHHPLSYLIRIISSLSAMWLVFYVVKFLPLTDVMLLNNTAPLFVPMITYLMLGAKTTRMMIVGMLIGFLGVVIILNPHGELFNVMSLLGLASGFFVALALVQIRLLGKSYSATHILFYYFLFSVLIMAPPTITQWVTPKGLKIWLMLFGIGIMGFIYQISSTFAYKLAPVRLMSPILYLSVLFGGIFDWLLFGIKPKTETLLGGGVIMIGVLITLIFGHRAISQEK